MHCKYVVNVVTRYDQIFYVPNLVMTRFSHVGGWQVWILVKGTSNILSHGMYIVFYLIDTVNIFNDM